MSIETTLYSTLSNNAGVAALVSTRIYPSLVPESAALPYVDYLNVAGSRINTLPGVGDAIRARIQMNCNATTYAGAVALADAVIAALEGDGYLELEYDLYSSETQTHTRIVDWSFIA